MKIQIDENTIKNILRDKDAMLQELHVKLNMIQKDMYEKEAWLKTAAYPSSGLSGMPAASSYNNKDLAVTLEEYYKLQREAYNELKQAVWMYNAREQAINRVWCAFMALEEPYHSMLRRIYVENEKYTAVEVESDMSHRTFEKYRKEAFNIIIRLYESSYSDADLLSMSVKRERNEKSKKKKKVTDYVQLDIDTWLSQCSE